MRRARRTRRSDRKLCALPIPARKPGRSSSKFSGVCRPLRSCAELSALVRGAAEAGLRALYPLASEREIFLRTARLALGEELFQQAYGNAIPPDGPAFRRP